MEYTRILKDLFIQVKMEVDDGKVASYIPELAKIDGNKFGVYLSTLDNRQFSIGDYNEKFSIQSIVKVLSLSLAFKSLGNKIWERVGVEPSGTPFNSLVQLEYDQGIPRNPLINAGAIVICDMLMSQFKDPKKEFLGFIRDVSTNPKIQYSESIAFSEKQAGFRNYAVCNLIKSFGNIENDIELVLDFYFHLCSIQMSCKELANTFLFLANHGKILGSGRQILNLSQSKRINAIMLTCGFYDEAGEFAFKVGLPGKSGVGGGIIAIHPNKYAIAVWSPKLNTKGNSARGMKFLELFTTETQSSIF